jgi:CBS domain-containing protein
VVDAEGVLVGIVSRSDLLRVFLRPDREILDEIVDEVLESTPGLVPGAIRAHVRDGVVTLHGRVERQGQAVLVRRLCLAVDGVVAVHDRLDGRPAVQVGS